MSKDDRFGDVTGSCCAAHSLWHEITNTHAFLGAEGHASALCASGSPWPAKDPQPGT